VKILKRKKLILLFFLIPLILAGFLWWSVCNRPVSSGEREKKYIVVAKGEGVDEISNKLYQENLIRSRAAFKIKAVIMQEVKNIQAGAYYLSGSMDLATIVNNLTKGSYDTWVTIPEGLRNEEVGQVMANELSIDKVKFIELAKDYEGYLFPDTYLIPKDYTEEQIVNLLKSTFDDKVKEVFDEDVRGQEINGFSFRGVMILASLVERETRFEEDRPIVAGVFIKRLKNDWPLQVDAAVQYAVATRNCVGRENCDWWPKKLSKSDLAIDSPYNTYQSNLLPPGPICNPGISAISAVINSKTTDYWYYLSDKDGKMHYAVTLSQHDKNIERYLTE